MVVYNVRYRSVQNPEYWQALLLTPSNFEKKTTTVHYCLNKNSLKLFIDINIVLNTFYQNYIASEEQTLKGPKPIRVEYLQILWQPICLVPM